MPLPEGWSHFSCRLKRKLKVTAAGVVEVFSMGGIPSFQAFDDSRLKCR